MEITFEQLPKAIGQLFDKLENIEQLLTQKEVTSQPEADELLTVQDAAKFLKLSVPTVYGLISKSALPVMKRSKRCYFSKLDLINYLKAGRKKTLAEAAIEAETYLLNNKKG